MTLNGVQRPRVRSMRKSAVGQKTRYIREPNDYFEAKHHTQTGN